MRQLKPNKRPIRRTFQPGVWIQYKTSLHQTQLHAKINRVQVTTLAFKLTWRVDCGMILKFLALMQILHMVKVRVAWLTNSLDPLSLALTTFQIKL